MTSHCVISGETAINWRAEDSYFLKMLRMQNLAAESTDADADGADVSVEVVEGKAQAGDLALTVKAPEAGVRQVSHESEGPAHQLSTSQPQDQPASPVPTGAVAAAGEGRECDGSSGCFRLWTTTTQAWTSSCSGNRDCLC